MGFDCSRPYKADSCTEADRGHNAAHVAVMTPPEILLRDPAQACRLDDNWARSWRNALTRSLAENSEDRVENSPDRAKTGEPEN